ncbi:hypothetical protein DFS34DRAFT_682908 [Phlyctochytrium arcticum]|nr:hypothetical protein DFS34DRAFT_682908 [Phlyctochytrium arcticum]
MYYQVFEMIDALFYADAGHCLRFRHIHGESEPAIGVVMADLDGGQYKGFGLDLQKLTAETAKMGWGEHLTKIFKSCKVHFQRNVLKNAAGKGRKGLRALMEAVTTHPDVTTIDHLFKEIIERGRECLMNRKLNFSPRSESSNEIEGLHADTNRDYQNGSLLHCISSRHEYDNRCWQQLEVGATEGVHYKAQKHVVQDNKTRMKVMKVRARSHARKPAAAANHGSLGGQL